jgi:GntR family transcriptional regulator
VLLQVDPESSVPLYAQIIERVKWGLVTGSLQEGDQLPSVRELATRLRINPNTVVKAYRELEHDGCVVTRQGQGTFVVAGPAVTRRERARIVARALADAVEVAFSVGHTRAEVEKLFQEILQQTQARFAAEGRTEDVR